MEHRERKKPLLVAGCWFFVENLKNDRCAEERSASGLKAKTNKVPGCRLSRSERDCRNSGSRMKGWFPRGRLRLEESSPKSAHPCGVREPSGQFPRKASPFALITHALQPGTRKHQPLTPKTQHGALNRQHEMGHKLKENEKDPGKPQKY